MSEHAEQETKTSYKPALVAIGLLVALYIVGAALGKPAFLFHPEPHGHADTASPIEAPPMAMIAPFAVLLAVIAILPLVPAASHWWEHNSNKLLVAGGLGAITLVYYIFFHGAAVESHWPTAHVVEPTGGADWGIGWAIFASTMFLDFIPFIMLLFSLYTISGGIRIEGDLRAHPLTNTTFMGIGALLASLIGTTGAAMLLIRPLLETNSERKHIKHTVVFFIFTVCNCGGLLLPLGDPPLFLGYLRGVPFLWTLNLWNEWLFVNGSLLVVYAALDGFYFYPHESARDIVRDETRVRGMKFSGHWLNGLLLLGVILSVALLEPSKTIPGTDWHPWRYLREVVQLGLVGLSLALGVPAVRQANRFNFGAIIEVAALFTGIFLCMQPALQILNVKGPNLGIDTPRAFFWISGSLSSVLDNAPTYVVFAKTAQTVTTPEMEQVAETGVAAKFLTAVSLGAVFMGAMTYIGNGPNFMVKAIAESSGVQMPSFFGYVVYSVTFLLPILFAMTLIFM